MNRSTTIRSQLVPEYFEHPKILELTGSTMQSLYMITFLMHPCVKIGQTVRGALPSSNISRKRPEILRNTKKPPQLMIAALDVSPSSGDLGDSAAGEPVSQSPASEYHGTRGSYSASGT